MLEAFDAVSVGDRVWIDDGKFGGVTRRVFAGEIELEIRQAPPGGGKLRAEKGINFPDTTLQIPAIRDLDEETIAFTVAHADMIGLSFASTADDVGAVAEALARNGGDQVGLVLKIETRAGFDALPELLTRALAREAPCGVMIARGDLAVEVGWERMAEVQEEILWLCEAAHVPVIWATQVLDTLARKGIASRAEITDAAIGCARRVRDAEQGTDDRPGDRDARRHPQANGNPPAQEDESPPSTPRLERRTAALTTAVGGSDSGCMVGVAEGRSRPPRVICA